MQIELTHKEIKETRRLGMCLASGIIPVNDVRKHLEGLQRKMETVSADPKRERSKKKIGRKELYKRKLRIA